MSDSRSDSPINLPLLLSLYLPSLLLSVCNGLLLPTLPVFASGLEVSYSIVGLILAGESLGMLFADVPAGLLISRFGRKRSMIIGLAIAALSVFALAFTTSAVQVIALRLLGGAGAALFNISRHVYMASELSEQSRGRVTALFGGTNRLGFLVGPIIGGFIAGHFGLGSTFITYAALAGITLLLCVIFVERGRGGGEESVRHAAPAHGSREMFAETLRAGGKVLIPAGLGQLCTQAIRMGRQVLIPLYAADVLNLPVESVGLVVSLAAIADFALFYVAGIIMDRYGRKWATVPSLIVQALSLLALPFAGGFSSLLLVGLIGGLGNGIGSGTMMTIGLDLAPRNRQSEFLGMWRFIGDVGSTAGPLVIGGLAEALGLSASSVVLAAVGGGGAWMFVKLVPETLERRRHAA